MASPRRAQGFTLLEVLVAMAILAVISVMAFSGWQQIQRLREGTDRALDRLSDIERALYWLENDFDHLIQRSITNEVGSESAPLQLHDFGEYLVELTRNGWRNPGGDSVDAPPRSSMVRVAYSLEEGKLSRSYWPYIDRMDQPAARKRFLMKQVTELKFRFLGDRDQWAERWPPLNADPEQTPPMPRAIEITLALEDLGKITRLIEVIQP